MAVFGTQTSVGTTATTVIVNAGSFVYPSGMFYICNAGAATIFIGGTPVTAALGYPINPGGSIGMMLEANETVYGLAAVGTGDARVLGITGSR
jgi:hypothetical protein